jgi:tRNA threonylcarbamoyl adenosine modification protein YjeE
VTFPFGEVLECHDEASLALKAQEFSKILKPGDICLLYGSIGAGKTYFTSKVFEALGGQVEYVGSPTFTLVNVYPFNKVQVYHVDLYRLEGVVEQDDVSQDLWMDPGQGYSFIEWAERLDSWVPESGYRITLSHLDHGRSLKIEPI